MWDRRCWHQKAGIFYLIFSQRMGINILGSPLWKSYHWCVLENSRVASNSLTVPALRWMLDGNWTLRLRDISPTRHFAYDMDISPTHFAANQTTIQA